MSSMIEKKKRLQEKKGEIENETKRKEKPPVRSQERPKPISVPVSVPIAKAVAEPRAFTVGLQSAYRSLQKDPEGFKATIETLLHDATLPEDRSLVHLLHDRVLMETKEKSPECTKLLAKASMASFPLTAEQPYSMGRIKLFANMCMRHKLEIGVVVTLRRWLVGGPMQARRGMGVRGQGDEIPLPSFLDPRPGYSSFAFLDDRHAMIMSFHMMHARRSCCPPTGSIPRTR